MEKGGEGEGRGRGKEEWSVSAHHPQSCEEVSCTDCETR